MVELGDVLKWLVAASASDVEALRTVIDALHPRALLRKNKEPEPSTAGGSVFFPPKAKAASSSRSRRAKRKASRRSYDDFGPKAETSLKTWETLKGSTDALTPKEISELIGVPAQRVSSILCAMYAGRRGRVLERKKVTTPRPDGSTSWGWTYRYAPRAGATT